MMIMIASCSLKAQLQLLNTPSLTYKRKATNGSLSGFCMRLTKALRHF